MPQVFRRLRETGREREREVGVLICGVHKRARAPVCVLPPYKLELELPRVGIYNMYVGREEFPRSGIPRLRLRDKRLGWEYVKV